ncbi:MAG TPA: hypothetical protein VHB99_08660 [Pirellulales bacterium]|nr:hypothetical protein [Pirellulales bacterium]
MAPGPIEAQEFRKLRKPKPPGYLLRALSALLSVERRFGARRVAGREMLGDPN